MRIDQQVDQNLTFREPVQHLLDHFLSEGFQASLDADGDIVFKCEGVGYALCFDRNDPEFAKLVLPGVWEIEDQTGLDQALLLLDNVNRRMKVVKGFTLEDRVWFTVEIWLTSQTEWTTYIRRAVRLLAHAARAFCEGMSEKKKMLTGLPVLGAVTE